MIAMKRKPKENYWGGVTQFRVHPSSKNALSRAKVNLRQSGTLRFQGRLMTEEVIFGALCLWAGEEDPRRLEAMLGPYVAQLESLVGGGAGEAEAEGETEAEGEVVYENADETGRKRKAPAPRPVAPTGKGKPRRKTS